MEAGIVSPPKLSILMLAYNLQEYVAQALDGVLMQQVRFPYEIVVGEDCSSDRTRDIVRSYARRHPDKIRPIFRPHNLGMNRNFVRTLEMCRGQYVALLDGDDYWTSPQKLQRQVDYLDKYPDCSICFHNMIVIYEDGSLKPHPFHLEEPIYRISKPMPATVSRLEDIVPGNFLQTGSVVFRRGLFDSLPEWFTKMPTYDWPLHVLNTERGNIAYLDELWGVYRVHEGGLWSTQMSTYSRLDDVENMIDAYALIDEHLKFRYSVLLLKPRISLYRKAACLSWSEQEYRKSMVYLGKWFQAVWAFRGDRSRWQLFRKDMVSLGECALRTVKQSAAKRLRRPSNELSG